MSNKNYRIEPIDPSAKGIGDCRRLLRLVFPSAVHFTENYLDWEYNQNPAGKAVGFNAYHDHELAGHYVTLPLRARLFGSDVSGLLSLNTATHPNHQGNGLFTKLAEHTYARARDLRFEFVIGVANANSTHGFVNKLGFQLVGRLSAKVGLKKVDIQKPPHETEFERLWDKELIRWRIANPSAHYGYSPASKGRVNILASAPHGLKVLLGQFDKEHIPDKALAQTRNWPQIWLGVNDRINWRRALHFEIPDRLRPSPLHLIFKDLTGKGRLLDLKNVFFSAIDFDAF